MKTATQTFLTDDQIAHINGRIDANEAGAASAVLTREEMRALPQMTKLVRIDTGAPFVKAYGDDAYAVNADGSYVKGGRKIGWKAGRFALRA